MFGEKLKKLRTDNNLTQEALAEKIFVTRTAISKWENNKGYPGIDSLKELSRLFGISIDELISDDDIEHKKLQDNKLSRKNYCCAVACFAAVVVFAVLYRFINTPYLLFASILSVVGYTVFAVLSKSRNNKTVYRQQPALYIVSRIVIIAVLIIVIVSAVINL